MSIMSVNRIKYLRETVEAEDISMGELSEIQDAFDQVPVHLLRDERENALAGDMLDELEQFVSPLEWAIYDYVVDGFGENEANDPSWDIGQLANALEEKFEVKEKVNADSKSV